MESLGAARVATVPVLLDIRFFFLYSSQGISTGISFSPTRFATRRFAVLRHGSSQTLTRVVLLALGRRTACPHARINFLGRGSRVQLSKKSSR